MTRKFTPLYEWVMGQEDLTRLEAEIVCRVLRWQESNESGCYESNNTLATALGANPRSIQRAIKRLVKKEWLAVFYPKKQHRIIYITPVKLSAGELFELTALGAKPTALGRPLTALGAKPTAYGHPIRYIRYIRELSESMIKAVAEKLRAKPKQISRAAEVKRQKELLFKGKKDANKN